MKPKKHLILIGFLLLVVFLISFSVVLSNTLVIDNDDMQFVVSNVTFTVDGAVEQISIDNSYFQVNNTRFYINSANPVRISNISCKGDNIDFDATCSAGNVWFNLSGFTPDYYYPISMDGTALSSPLCNSSGYISFLINSWSSHGISIAKGQYENGVSNIWSDGTYLYMGMEDGNIPSMISAGIDDSIQIDSNSSIHGKYCTNITRKGNVEEFLTTSYYFDNYIKTSSYSIKFIIKEMPTDGDIFISCIYPNAGIFSVLSLKNLTTGGSTVGQIRITDLATYQRFTSMEPWQKNQVYTLTLSDITYRTMSATVGHLYSATLSNSTSSQTIANLQSSVSIPYYGMIPPIAGIKIYDTVSVTAINNPSSVFVDDILCGQQTIIDSSSATSVEETSATANGDITNDGSTYQNGTQTNLSCKILYDIEPHDTFYSYYFTEYDTTILNFWDIGASDMVNGITTDYAGGITENVNPERQTQYLINHSGNHSIMPTENITDVYIGVKGFVDLDNRDGNIIVTPMYNGTTIGTYRINANYNTGNTNWHFVQIGKQQWNWSMIKYLKCWVNLTDNTDGHSYIGYVSIVTINVTVNATRDYSHNISATGEYTGDTLSENLASLTPGKLYYYRTYGETNYTNASSLSYSDEQYFLTKPNPPTTLNLTHIGGTGGGFNISWTVGTGKNTTVVRVLTTDYPTLTTGTEIYNGTGTYYHHTGLTAGTNYKYRVWSFTKWTVNPTLYHFSDDYDGEGETYVSPPTVTTLDASNIWNDSALFRGQITDDGGMECYTKFYYVTNKVSNKIIYHYNSYTNSVRWTNPINMVDNSTATVASTNNVLDSYITLNSNTVSGTPKRIVNKVEISIYAKIIGASTYKSLTLTPVFSGTIYGTPLSQNIYNVYKWYTYDITDDTAEPGSWTWNDLSALDIYLQTAQMQANIMNICAVRMNITYISLNDNLSVPGTYNTNDIFNNNTNDILNPGTFYYYYAYANNSFNNSNYDWGNEKYFLTKPNHANLTITNIWHGFNLSWDKGLGANKTLIRYKTIGYPTTTSDGTLLYNDTGTYTIHSLSGNGGTTYYYSIWSYKDYTYSPTLFYQYSNITIGSSIYVDPPTVTTQDATNIWNNTATMQGYLDNDGGNPIDARVRFSIGYTTSYGTNSSNQTKSTGDYFHNQTNHTLTPGHIYHYRAFANNSFATNNTDLGDDKYFLTKPNQPINAIYSIINKTTVNISWTNGTSKNTTVLVGNNNHYPTSPTDGTIYHNGTARFKIINNLTTGLSYYFTLYSFSKWIVNPTVYMFSNATNLSFGGLFLGVYNESKPWQNVSFNVLIQNQSGSQVYQAKNCHNYHSINFTLCPHGFITLYFEHNISGYYYPRTYTKTLNAGAWLVFDAYLPPVKSSSGNGSGGSSGGCELRTYTDTVTIVNYNYDSYINTTYKIQEIIEIQLYNKSLYGTYGGWITVANNKYQKIGEKQILVNKSILDKNSTMLKAFYYYEYCTGEQITTSLYYLRVMEETEVEYNIVDVPVSDAEVNIKRYFNTTGVYTNVSILHTDGNGYVNLYLIPGAFYKVDIRKTGFEESIGNDYIPAPPNQFGQTVEKIFKIVRIIDTSVYKPDFYGFATVNWNWRSDNTTFYVHYIDSTCKTTSITIYVYCSINNTLIDTETNISSACDWNYTSPAINSSYSYYFYIDVTYVNSDGTWTYHMGEYAILALFNALFNTNLEDILDTTIGKSPLYLNAYHYVGWGACLVLLVFTFVLFTFDKMYAGVGLVISGFAMSFMGLVTGMAVVSLTLIGFVVFIGILVVINERKDT